METNLPTPMTARVYVNLPEGILISYDTQLGYPAISSISIQSNASMPLRGIVFPMASLKEAGTFLGFFPPHQGLWIL